MSKAIWWFIAIAGTALFALIVYYAMPTRERPPAPQAPAQAPAPTPPAATESAAPPEPQIRYPVAPPPPEKPLPALETSDSTMRNALGELLSDKSLIDLFEPPDFVRRVVATVDNLPREKLPIRLLPAKRATGQFAVDGKEDDYTISDKNSARYAPYMRLVAALDARKTVALYIHFYPLFQQAYRELGYPKGYFNDRLIEVIDHLLAAPDVAPPIKLVQPKVFYQYADPKLESLSAGRKILVRMGSENAALVKAKLRELRSELVQQGKGEKR